jgi:hypothetical protein
LVKRFDFLDNGVGVGHDNLLSLPRGLWRGQETGHSVRKHHDP